MAPPDVKKGDNMPGRPFEGISALAGANPWQTQKVFRYLRRFAVAPANLEYLSSAEQALVGHDYALTFVAQELFEKAAAIHRESVEAQTGGDGIMAKEHVLGMNNHG